MIHKLKIWPQYYARQKDGTKTWEIRDNDRDFQAGDILILQEWDPTPITSTDKAPKGYTKSEDLYRSVPYVHVLNSSQVIMTTIPCKKPKE